MKNITPSYTKILLILKDKYNLPYKEDAQNFINDNDFLKISFNKIRKKITDFSFKPLFSSLDINDISSLVNKAVKSDPTYEPVDFTKYFHYNVKNKSNLEIEVILKVLKISNLFKTIEIQGNFKLADVDHPENNPDYTRLQDYLKPYSEAPLTLGINAVTAWNLPGGDGANINFIDVENGWNFSHEDLQIPADRLMRDIRVPMSTASRDVSHGTSVLGIIAAQNNDKGGIGIAPSCIVKTVCCYNCFISDTILSILNTLEYGDILLLEVQTLSECPIEIETDTQVVIRLATALGIVIIEPAGNVGRDLDDPSCYSGMLKIGNPNFKDSGAIMVGGVNPSDKTRFGTNWGSRVNCFAWGNGIYSPGGVADTSYVNFDCTSGASAIIAGVAVSTQGIINANPAFRRKFNSFQMRHLLSGNGISSANPLTDKLGVMPNFDILSSYFNGVDVDIYIRDNWDDNGDRYAGNISLSPDIIISNRLVPNPTLAYGVGSGTENRTDLSDTVKSGTENRIYFRVLNRGRLDASNVKIKLYYADVATLPLPSMWNYIGFTTIPSVQAGNQLTVSENPIIWSTGIPPSGHYCFVAIIGNDEDPSPLDSTEAINLNDFDTFRRLIRENNNITWRNFNVEEMAVSATSSTLAFNMVTPMFSKEYKNKKEKYSFNINGILPENTKINLVVNQKMLRHFGKMKFKINPSLNPERNSIELVNKSSFIFNNIALENIKLPHGLTEKCFFELTFPDTLKANDEYQISISQHLHNEMIGKVTWVFKGKKTEKG